MLRRPVISVLLAGVLALILAGGCPTDSGYQPFNSNRDAGPAADARVWPDAGPPGDAAVGQDAAPLGDADVTGDAAPEADADVQTDAALSADAAVPPLLDDTHSGWVTGIGSFANTDCFGSGCHVQAGLGAPHTGGQSLLDCPSCHGANGACDPDGDYYTIHQLGDDCVVCHVDHHGYSLNADCVACHMPAAGGTADCTP